MLRSLLLAAAITAFALAILLVLVWWGQERVVFQPPAVGGVDVREARRLGLRADDGTPLFAYLAGDPAAVRDAGLVIHFHGNAEVAAWTLPWAEELARRSGMPVLVAEYRGYAGIPGRPTYERTGRDARALWQTAERELGATPGRTVIHGFSLGSAVAAELAAVVGPRALVLEAPFSSAKALAERMPLLRGPVWRLVGRIRFDTRGIVARLDAPVWVAHGDSDMIIPPRMGREVFEAARRKGGFLSVPGAGHNDMRDGAAYWAWLQRAVGDSGAGAR